MFRGFFFFFCILITFITFAHHYYKDKRPSQNSLLFLKFFIGFSCGLLGILLLMFSVNVTETIIVDFRNIAVILSAVFGGLLSAVITAVMIALFRVLHFGITKAAITAVVSILILAFGTSLISIYNMNQKLKWVYMSTLNLLVSFISLYTLISNKKIYFETMTLYSISTILIVLFLYRFTEYLREFNEFYNKLKSDSTKDFLTGLNNVREFDNLFNKMVNRINRSEEQLSILFIDVDFFKMVNDKYGHSTGDLVLKELANILVHTCRDFDIISRNGGEEFSVMLFDCPISHAFVIAERIRRNVEEYKFQISQNESIHVTISIGISAYPEVAKKPKELLEQADAALYEAKKTGRNKISVYTANNIIET